MQNCVIDSDIGIQNLDDGEFHNFLVNLTIENLTSCPDNSASLSNSMKSIIIANSSLIENQFQLENGSIFSVMETLNLDDHISPIFNNPNYWSYQITNSNFSNDLISAIVNAESLFDNIPENVITVDDFSLLICEYFTTNIDQISDYDEKIYFESFIDVLNKSAKLWAPSEVGGLGSSELLQNKYGATCSSSVNSNNVEKRGIWGSFRDWAMSTAAGVFVLTDATMAVTATAAALTATAGAGALPLCGGIPCAGVAGVITGAGASIASQIPYMG